MAVKNPKEYYKNRYHKRKAMCLERLGGICKNCGTTDNLEFDHIDPSTKEFTLAEGFMGISFERLSKELKKCQLLCHKCHMDKTLEQRGILRVEGRHGTVTTAKYCNCGICKEAFNQYTKKWRDKLKEKVGFSTKHIEPHIRITTSGKYQSVMWFNGRYNCGGTFNTIEEARVSKDKLLEEKSKLNYRYKKRVPVIRKKKLLK